MTAPDQSRPEHGLRDTGQYLAVTIGITCTIAGAALILGAIWMVWHVRAFLVSGIPRCNMSFQNFAVGGIDLNVFPTGSSSTPAKAS